jgi:hypothetical protein
MNFAGPIGTPAVAPKYASPRCWCWAAEESAGMTRGRCQKLATLAARNRTSNGVWPSSRLFAGSILAARLSVHNYVPL